MGILDEAIREHLDLKRQHGADDSELKQLEDDAFGPPQRPGAEDAPSDAASEAATEFMAQPDLGDAGGNGEAEPQPESSTRREPVAEVQEAPEPAEDEDHEEEPAAEEDHDELPAEEDHEEEPAAEEEPEDEPAVEEQPAGEHEAVPPPQASHTTEERHAIADQPTEMYDVEGGFAATEGADPSDEELVAEEITEPRLAPAEPLDALTADDDADADDEAEVGVQSGGEEEDDDFFDEQRLSDELDQALEAPLEPESEEIEQPASEKFESEEMDLEADSEEVEQPAARPADEDVLEETPDFLEEAPEDDQLWFEQKPPKDFDFDD